MAFATVYYHSKLGILKITATGVFVTSIAFTTESMDELPGVQPAMPAVMQKCVDELAQYFEGTLRQFTFPFAQHGSVFQQQVWHELYQIEYGQTISYRSLSERLGNVKAIRAAASANGKNSLAIVVPCHRVIGSNGSLTGYAGELWRKKWLLDHEAQYAHGVRTLF